MKFKCMREYEIMMVQLSCAHVLTFDWQNLPNILYYLALRFYCAGEST